MVYILNVCCKYTFLLTMKINENGFYIGLKCWIKSACLKEEHHVSIESY